MFIRIIAVIVFVLCAVASSEAKAQSNPFAEEHVWVAGMQLHMAYDGQAEQFMTAPGVHFFGIGHKTSIALGASIAYFANQKYSMGAIEPLIGYDVTPSNVDVHVVFSSGLGVYGYGNAEREVVALSLPMRVHFSFADRVVLSLGSRMYYDAWSHPFPFDVGLGVGF